MITFTPSTDLCGNDAGRLRLRASPTARRTDTGHVTVDITCVNDEPGRGRRRRLGHRGHRRRDHGRRPRRQRYRRRRRRLTVTAVSNPSGGTVSLATGTITFVPDRQPVRRRRGQLRLHGRGRQRRHRHRHGHHRPHLRQRRARSPSTTPRPSTATPAAADHDVLANDTDVDAGDTLTLQSAVLDSGLGHGERQRRQGPLHAAGRLQRPGRDHVHRQRRHRHRHAPRSRSPWAGM